MSSTGMRSLAALVVSIALLAAKVSPAPACGFDGLLGNSLSAMHPKSIEVALAIRDAIVAGTLDKSAADPIVAGSAGYWRAVGHLNAFQRVLSAVSDRSQAATAPTIAVLFIDSSLWARLTPTAHGFDIRVHVDGAQPGDVVIVTNEPLLAAILEKRLNVETALARGVLAIDGEPNAATRVRALIQSMPINAGAGAPALPTRFFGPALR